MFKKNLIWVRNNISGGIDFMLLSNQFFDDQDVKDAFNVINNSDLDILIINDYMILKN